MTPAAWLEVLEKRLAEQQREIAVFERYYAGQHRLAFATSKFREAFGSLFGTFADNWCQIVVDAAVERLAVEGFRFGDDQDSDDAAWRIWQANNLDAESVVAHTEAIKCGSAYLLVDPNGGAPRITTEHASQVIVAHAAGDRRQRLAALKKWLDDDGFAYANVYLPEGVYKFRSTKEVRGDIGYGSRVQWTRREGADVRGLGVVPVIPLYNNPGMLTAGRSDLETAVPLQDAINKQVLDMIVASEFQAFRQRVLTGVEIPKDPVTGQPVAAAELKAAQSRLWVFENENAKVSEFGESDLKNYVAAIEMLIRHLAAQTRTPPHYLMGEIVNASGDALKAAEAGLVARVTRKQRDFSDGWEEALRLAFLATGDDRRAGTLDAQTLWKDPENRTEGETVDAAVKLRSIGVPYEMVWARVGYSPQEIARMLRMAGLPDRPPAGATTAQTVGSDAPPSNGNGDRPVA